MSSSLPKRNAWAISKINRNMTFGNIFTMEEAFDTEPRNENIQWVGLSPEDAMNK